ncbi:hypothetical protein [Parasphingorhabdus sp.]|uniref:hypothetical protein n=1 Tax=Parasphingorhabdus sp. TaxID=2709688 RepID=UPI003001BBCD
MNCNGRSYAILGCLLVLPGCSGASGEGGSPTGVQPDRDWSSLDEGPVMRAAHAILIGKQGEENADADALRAAAQTLAGLGARPDAEEQEDLSRRWGEQAKRIDPLTTLPVYRGRALGPSYQKGTVSAVSKVSTDQIFLAGKKASVALVPVSSKPMSIRIFDDQGKNICSQSTSSKPANCQWLPLFTERYRINIHTSESRPVNYYLVSN